jgi:hypothetical protein
LRLDDPCDLREDRLEVFSSVAAEGPGDVLPDHVSRSNHVTCPSRSSVTFSHLLYYSDLLHEQTAAFAVKPGAFTSYAQILARTTACNDVYDFNFIAFYLGYITVVFHVQSSSTGV